MSYQASAEDISFVQDVESCSCPVSQFDHRAHLRVAYVYLCQHDSEGANRLMYQTLERFLAFHKIDASKFHTTVTLAWILAVKHFMASTPSATSFDQFASRNPLMFDSRIMRSHYSDEVLSSEDARERFVEPDRDPIPRHD